MNEDLRARMEYLVNCDDKAITPDVKDDVQWTLEYIDELEKDLRDACEVIEHLKKDKREMIYELEKVLSVAETGWIEHLNGTVIGYMYPRDCCKERIKYIRGKLNQIKEKENE